MEPSRSHRAISSSSAKIVRKNEFQKHPHDFVIVIRQECDGRAELARPSGATFAPSARPTASPN
jgi:hypothetical protein